MASERSAAEALRELSAEKFVLLAGPRQVGKTTLAAAWVDPRGGEVLSWDAPRDRRRILANEPYDAIGALVLDEFHKYAGWKRYLKGLYDKCHAQLRVVVTGSARLDVFRRGGESMLGRYELLRLHPLSLGELTHGRLLEPPVDWLGLRAPKPAAPGTLELLETMGGFPEPFFRGEARFHERWSQRRDDLLLRQDLRELTQIRALSQVEHLWMLLPERVGSPLSLNSLREQIGVAHGTVSSWVDALERLYLVYRLSPFVSRRGRSLTRERKLYLWDWSQLSDPGARLENLVASHLLKAVQLWNDLGHGRFELHYFRDREKREVDFVVTNRTKPVVAIECKVGDDSLAPSLAYLGRLIDVPCVQLVRRPGIDRRGDRVRSVSVETFLASLP